MAARARIAWQQEVLDNFVRVEIPQLQQVTQEFFAALAQQKNIDDLVFDANRFAALLGKQLEFKNMEEFDGFMGSERSLVF